MSLKLMNHEKLLSFIALSHSMMYRMLNVFYPVEQLTVSELRHAVDISYICMHGFLPLFVHMAFTTAIGSTFPVHLDVSNFPIGETPIRIDGFFEDEVLTLATPSIVIPLPGRKERLYTD